MVTQPKRKIVNKEENNKLTLLIVGKDYFKEEINKRIILGEEIHSRQIQTNRQYEQAKDDFQNWDDFNSELLKQSLPLHRSETYHHSHSLEFGCNDYWLI